MRVYTWGSTRAVECFHEWMVFLRRHDLPGNYPPLIDVCDDYRHGRREEEGEFKSPENASSLGSDFSGIFAPGEEESKGSIGNI